MFVLFRTLRSKQPTIFSGKQQSFWKRAFRKDSKINIEIQQCLSYEYGLDYFRQNIFYYTKNFLKAVKRTIRLKDCCLFLKGASYTVTRGDERAF